MSDTTYSSGTVIASSWLNDVNRLTYDIPSTSASKGASLVGVQDSGGYFHSANVEGSLQEVGVELARANGYNILRDITPSEWAAILDGTTTFDVSTIVRTRITALGQNGKIYFPGKKYVFSTADGGATISAYMRISVSGFTIVADPNCKLTFTDGAVAGVYADVNAQLFRIVGGLWYGTNTTTPTIELVRISAPYPIVQDAGFAFAAICVNYLGVVGTGVYVVKQFRNQFSNADIYVKYGGSATADFQSFGNTYGTTTIGTTNACIECGGLGSIWDDYFETQNHTKVAFRVVTGAQRATLRGVWLDSGEIEVQTSCNLRAMIDAQDCYHTTNARFIRVAAGATADFTGSELDGNGAAGGIFGISASGTFIMGGGVIKQFQTGVGFAGLTTLGNVMFNTCGTAVSANSGASGEACGLVYSGCTTDATLNAGSTFRLNRIDSVTAAPAAAGTVTPDLSKCRSVFITMPAGNITVAAPTNPYLNAELVIGATQDAVGGRTITWNAVFKKAADGAGAANAKGVTRFVYDGTNWIQQGGALAFF